MGTIGSQLWVKWAKRANWWMILILLVMVTSTSSDKAELKSRTFYSRFGGEISLAMVGGYVEVACLGISGGSGCSTMKLIHEIDGEVASEKCGGNAIATFRLNITEDSRFGRYFCQIGDDKNTRDDEEALNHVYRTCNISEAMQCNASNTCVNNGSQVVCSANLDWKLCSQQHKTSDSHKVCDGSTGGQNSLCHALSKELFGAMSQEQTSRAIPCSGEGASVSYNKQTVMMGQVIMPTPEQPEIKISRPKIPNDETGGLICKAMRHDGDQEILISLTDTVKSLDPHQPPPSHDHDGKQETENVDQVVDVIKDSEKNVNPKLRIPETVGNTNTTRDVFNDNPNRDPMDSKPLDDTVERQEQQHSSDPVDEPTTGKLDKDERIKWARAQRQRKKERNWKKMTPWEKMKEDPERFMRESKEELEKETTARAYSAKSESKKKPITTQTDSDEPTNEPSTQEEHERPNDRDEKPSKDRIDLGDILKRSARNSGPSPEKKNRDTLQVPDHWFNMTAVWDVWCVIKDKTEKFVSWLWFQVFIFLKPPICEYKEINKTHGKINCLEPETWPEGCRIEQCNMTTPDGKRIEGGTYFPTNHEGNNTIQCKCKCAVMSGGRGVVWVAMTFTMFVFSKSKKLYWFIDELVDEDTWWFKLARLVLGLLACIPILALAYVFWNLHTWLDNKWETGSFFKRPQPLPPPEKRISIYKKKGIWFMANGKLLPPACIPAAEKNLKEENEWEEAVQKQRLAQKNGAPIKPPVTFEEWKRAKEEAQEHDDQEPGTSGHDQRLTNRGHEAEPRKRSKSRERGSHGKPSMGHSGDHGSGAKPRGSHGGKPRKSKSHEKEHKQKQKWYGRHK